MILLAHGVMVGLPNILSLSGKMSLLYLRICLLRKGAFIEPITVGLHAFHLAQGCENKNVIIIGAGTIGLLAIQCAVALGSKECDGYRH